MREPHLSHSNASSGPNASRGLRWLHRSGLLLHWIAFVACLFGAAILAVGALHFEISEIEFEIDQWQRPVLYGIGIALIGRALARTVPFRDTPGPRITRALVRGLRARRERAWIRVAVPLVLLAIGLHAFQRARSWMLVKEARARGATGHAAAAAEAFRAARYRFAANNADLRDEEADYLYQAGRFEDVIECLSEPFERREALSPAAYRALWRSYDARGNYDAALLVVREAMRSALNSSEAQMAECTRLVARYQSLALGRDANGVGVRLRVAAPAGKPWTLSGNWARTGEVSSLHGWTPLELTYDAAEGAWVHEVSLAHSQELPCVAIARAEGETPRVAVFRVSGEHDTLVELAPCAETAPARAPVQRQDTADGRSRVLVLWPDCGSWQLIHFYSQLGYLPNMTRLIEQGTSIEMIAARPAFTATSYVQMTELDPEERRRRDDSSLNMLLLQLNGLPIVDALIPDEFVLGGNDRSGNLFAMLNAHGLSVANMVFSDKTIHVSEEHAFGKTGSSKLPSKKKSKPWRNAEDRDRMLATLLGIDRESEPERWERCAKQGFAVECIRNTDEKAQAGLDVWTTQRPDFQLLRFPAVDIASHQYITDFDKAPVTNALLEVYRHLDGVIGRFAAACDADDTLVLVSDHGISGPLTHDESCVLVLEGPDLPADLEFGTIPIGHFPGIMLSRFGIREPARARMTAEEQALFFRNQ